ncbi:MAG: Ig-like domain-containing protein [Trueperaceae bacterium]|nr:Ig-like domain-containing protein [Trueperaceae bacterium]
MNTPIAPVIASLKKQKKKPYGLWLLLLVILFLIATSCTTVSKQAPSLSVSPSAVNLQAGDPSTTFKVTLKNSTGDVSWTLSPELGTLSSTTGLEVSYTPPLTVEDVSTLTLTASLGNLSDSATLTINPAAATGFTISGQVQDYDRGEASLEAISFDREVMVGIGSIAADGSFSLALLVPADKNLLAAEKPCPEINQRPADFNLTSVVSLKIIKDGLGIGDLFHASGPDAFAANQVSYTYVDRDVSISGSCLVDGVENTFDLSFKQGWNLLLRESSDNAISFTSPESVEMPWLFSPSFPTDDTPAVISVDPADGATGVRDDQSIIITFNKSMAQAATEAAYQSDNLPASEVTFSWNAEATILTITPNDFLEYAAGDNPDIEAISYTFGIGGTAQDELGNAMEPFSSSFSTLKVIVTNIYATANLDGHCYGSGGCDTAQASFPVGDLATAPTDSGFRSFLSFDLSSIPEGVITDEAQLIIYKAATNFNSGPENPYPLGDMILEQVNYGESLTGDDYDTPALADLGIFDSAAQPAIGYLASDVTSALNDDLANRIERGNRSQYRLRFPIENNDNGNSDFVQFFSSDGPEGQRPFLNIVYYLP